MDSMPVAENIVSNSYYSPEERLLSAILNRAITDLYGKAKGPRNSAYSWIFQPEMFETDFSFCYVCECLKLNPDRLRHAINTMEPRKRNARII